MSKRVDKLLNITIGELRERLAYVDADELVKYWLEDEDFEEANDSYENEVESEEDYDDWDDEEDYYDEDEDTDEVGSLSLPSEEEKLAMDIADDIDNGKYSLDSIRTIYPAEMIARIEYLID